MLRSAAVFIVAIIVLLVAFYFAERSFSPAFQTCVEKHQAADSNRIAEDDITGRWISLVEHSIRCSGEFVEANSAAITALAAILVAAFTASLWIATGRQAKLTRQAVMAGKRAFVFPTGVVALPESNAQTGSFHWRLVPAWENSGETPTRNLRIYADCILTNVPLPESFSFTQIDPEEPPAMAMLGPKATSKGGIAPHAAAPALTPQDILDIQSGQRFLYLWGWARYSDLLPNTPERITRFCWQIIADGNPLTFNPLMDPQGLRWSNIHQRRGNCADDECRWQGLG
jgi:hypothetical protein